jgi:putative transposase
VVIFKGAHFEAIVILTSVRWYLAYPLSYRQLEEMMQARGVAVDHSTINRWVLKYVPQLEHEFRRRKRLVGTNSRLDETYIKVKGTWTYLYGAVDMHGQTIDFLLTTQRDRAAAHAAWTVWGRAEPGWRQALPAVLAVCGILIA